MQELDFGEIMERECWFEDYDLSCPHCKGNPEVEVKTWTGKCLDPDCKHEWEVKVKEVEDWDLFKDGPEECPECASDEIETDEGDTDTEYCEKCSEGSFEVMWNTAFGVDVPTYKKAFEDLRKEAWDLGWCLIDHGGSYFLLAGGCGYDFSWRLQHARWKLQEYLDLEDMRRIMGTGGHVFLGAGERDELLRYIRNHLPTPHEYQRSYAQDLETIDKMLFPKKEKEEHAHKSPVHAQ